jgi:hypothetical protein
MHICPSCSTANSEQNEKCWICGYEFTTGLLNGELLEGRKRRLPKFVDGELVWLDNENGGNEDGASTVFDNNNTTVNSEGTKINESGQTLTRADKMEILKRDLTGLHRKTKFREGVKWL